MICGTQIIYTKMINMDKILLDSIETETEHPWDVFINNTYKALEEEIGMRIATVKNGLSENLTGTSDGRI